MPKRVSKVIKPARGYAAKRPLTGPVAVEGDNHLVELAVAGSATRIVTRNLRDLRGMELKFPELVAVTPEQFLKEVKS